MQHICTLTQVCYALHRKTGTAIVTAWVTYYGLFHIDYGIKDHALSGLQRWHRRKLDEMLGITGKSPSLENQVNAQEEQNEIVDKEKELARKGVEQFLRSAKREYERDR